MKEEEKGNVLKAKRYLEAISKGKFGSEIERKSIKDLRILQAQKGLFHCSFVVPQSLSDKDGNWHTAAIAILIDNVGASAVGSAVGEANVSVNFDISYFSSVKIQEEVEIEAKVLNQKEKLATVMVEIRRKENGEMVAIGKQWMASINAEIKILSKI